MTSIEIVEARIEPSGVISEVAAVFELTVTSDGALKSLPGSRHWHLKRAKQRGTLEITHWPQEGRLWVCYHSNRAGSWVPDIAQQFAASLAEKVCGRIE